MLNIQMQVCRENIYKQLYATHQTYVCMYVYSRTKLWPKTPNTQQHCNAKSTYNNYSNNNRRKTQFIIGGWWHPFRLLIPATAARFGATAVLIVVVVFFSFLWLFFIQFFFSFCCCSWPWPKCCSVKFIYSSTGYHIFGWGYGSQKG